MHVGIGSSSVGRFASQFYVLSTLLCSGRHFEPNSMAHSRCRMAVVHDLSRLSWICYLEGTFSVAPEPGQRDSGLNRVLNSLDRQQSVHGSRAESFQIQGYVSKSQLLK